MQYCIGGKLHLQSVNERSLGEVRLQFKGPDRLRKGLELVLYDIPSVKSVVFEEFIVE